MNRPYKTKERLGRAGEVTECEACGRIARAHASRLLPIGRSATESEEPSTDVFLSFLQTLEKNFDAEWRRNPQRGRRERHFKVQLFEGSRQDGRYSQNYPRCS